MAASPYTYLDPAKKKYDQGGGLGAYSAGTATGGSMGTGMPTDYSQPMDKLFATKATQPQEPDPAVAEGGAALKTPPPAGQAPAVAQPPVVGSVPAGAVPPPPPPPPPTPNAPPAGYGSPGSGVTDSPLQGMPYVPPISNAGPTGAQGSVPYSGPDVHSVIGDYGMASLKAPQAVQMETVVAPPAAPQPVTPPPAMDFANWVDPSQRTASAVAPPPVTKQAASATAQSDPNAHWAGGAGATYGTGASPEETAAWNFQENRPKTPEELAEKNGGAQVYNGPVITDPHLGDNVPTTQTGSPKDPSLNPNDYTPGKTAVDPYLATQNADFQAWLKKQMDNPSPYSTDLIKQGQAVLEDGISRAWVTGQRQIEEYFASRGLTGSGLEAQAMKDLKGQMEEQYRKGNFDLGQAQVAAYQTQTQTVGNLGLGFANNLSGQQQNALADVRDQMSLALQKYGYDKSSADAAAGRQLQKELADAQRASTEKMHKQDLIGQYGGQTYTPEQWDAYDAQHGAGSALQDLGPRPAGAAGATGTTEPGGDNAYPTGTKPTDAPSDNPAMNSDIYNYKAIPDQPYTAPMKQQRYDAFVAKYGAEAATKNLGTRPGSAALTPLQAQNLAALAGPNAPLAARQAAWDDYAQKHGQQDATGKLGSRPTA